MSMWLGNEKSRFLDRNQSDCPDGTGRSAGRGRISSNRTCCFFPSSPLQRWASTDSHRDQNLRDSTATQSVFKYVEVNSYCSYGLRTEKRVWVHCIKSSKDKGKQISWLLQVGPQTKTQAKETVFLGSKNWLQAEVSLFILWVHSGNGRHGLSPRPSRDPEQDPGDCPTWGPIGISFILFF